MSVFVAYRLFDDKPGCVDFLGEIDAESAGEAEMIARLMFAIDWGAGERLDVIQDQPQRTAAPDGTDATTPKED